MKRVLNFILNQLGLIVVLFAGVLVYYDYFDLDLYFGMAIGAILIFVLIASEMTYKSLKRDMKRKRKQIKGRARIRAV